MRKQLYPVERKPRDRSHLPWKVEYDLAYDGGGSRWSQYYRWYWQARLMAFLNYHVFSWGGSAVLYDNRSR